MENTLFYLERKAIGNYFFNSRGALEITAIRVTKESNFIVTSADIWFQDVNGETEKLTIVLPGYCESFTQPGTNAITVQSSLLVKVITSMDIIHESLMIDWKADKI